MTKSAPMELQVRSVPLAVDVSTCLADRHGDLTELVFSGRVPSGRRDLGAVTIVLPFMDGLSALLVSSLVTQTTAEAIADDLTKFGEAKVALLADSLWFSRERGTGALRITARDASSPTSFGSGDVNEACDESAPSPTVGEAAWAPAYFRAMEFVADHAAPRFKDLFGESPTQDSLVRMIHSAFIAESHAHIPTF